MAKVKHLLQFYPFAVHTWLRNGLFFSHLAQYDECEFSKEKVEKPRNLRSIHVIYTHSGLYFYATGM